MPVHEFKSEMSLYAVKFTSETIDISAKCLHRRFTHICPLFTVNSTETSCFYVGILQLLKESYVSLGKLYYAS